MFDSVGRGEIKEWSFGGFFSNEFIYLRTPSVSQKHGTSLRTQHNHVTRAVVFLITPRSLMFADDVVVVFINRATRHDANLLVLTHHKAVQVKAGCFFSYERTAFDQRFEIVDAFAINSVAV